VKGTLLDHEALSHLTGLKTQLSLLNNEDSADIGLLLIQEPYHWRIDEPITVTPPHHPYWTPYIPTTYDKEHR
jgi:hypothetical protein